MPIVNYATMANNNLRKLFTDAEISEANKQYVKEEFVPNYKQKPATQEMVYNHLRSFLKYTDDIKRDMQDEKTFTKILTKLQEDKPGYFEKFRGFMPKFCRYINGGETPKAVINAFKKFPKRANKRNLNREDMHTWQDGVKLIDATNDVQLKAIIATQLDCGFRPSEFVDLNYGDIEIKKDFIVLKVRDGKTGARDVIAWRCVPYLLRWVQAHPSKLRSSPLWVYYGNNQQQDKKMLKRYEYFALSKRIKELAQNTGIKKPVDFYSLRHSSCFNDKLDNLPLDVAAERHGHSIKYFTDIYGRLDVDDKINKIKRHYGSEDIEHKKAEQNVRCLRCNNVNEPGLEYCSQCAAPLNMKVAIAQDKNKDAEIAELREQMANLRDLVTKAMATPKNRGLAALKAKK